MGYCWIESKMRGRKQIKHVKCNGYSHYCEVGGYELKHIIDATTGKETQEYCKDCQFFVSTMQEADEIMHDFLMEKDEDYFVDNPTDKSLLELLKNKLND